MSVLLQVKLEGLQNFCLDTYLAHTLSQIRWALGRVKAWFAKNHICQPINCIWGEKLMCKNRLKPHLPPHAAGPFVTRVGDLRDTLGHAGYQELLEAGDDLSTRDHKRSSLAWGDDKSCPTGSARDLPCYVWCLTADHNHFCQAR